MPSLAAAFVNSNPRHSFELQSGMGKFVGRPEAYHEIQCCEDNNDYWQKEITSLFIVSVLLKILK